MIEKKGLMDPKEARETKRQLIELTRSFYTKLGYQYDCGGPHNYKGEMRPIGAVNHFTASAMNLTEKNPYGRLRVLMPSFALNHKNARKVGVQAIVWDRMEPTYIELRNKFDLLRGLPTVLLYYGKDSDKELAMAHAGWVNPQLYGVEIRNIGRLKSATRWEHGVYNGRPAIRVGNSWWEPFTWEQMAGTLWFHRLMVSLYPEMKPQNFLGHTHVSDMRIDPGLHFPMHEMRQASFDQSIPLIDVPFLKEFTPCGEQPIDEEDDPGVSEISEDEGLYEEDWDGRGEEARPAVSPPTGDDIHLLRELGLYTDEGVKEVTAWFIGRWTVSQNGKRVRRFRGRTELDFETKKLLRQYWAEWTRL